MKTIISPSILAADFNILGQQIQEIEKSGAEYLHIDVMDGVFVPSISFGMPVIASIRPGTKLFFDVHLMIVEPVRYVETFAQCGADMITFHLEAAGERTAETIDRIHALGCKAGISIKPGTPVAALEPYIKQVDMVLVMTVAIARDKGGTESVFITVEAAIGLFDFGVLGGHRLKASALHKFGQHHFCVPP